ncbi:helix-turn-helix domain-containing protein [Miniimonas arenae]|uniref:helix-turn-helix domain-containing protein n=1 Tax=Miniimonas arenae TaxID=676201 RepID=UPI0035E433A5
MPPRGADAHPRGPVRACAHAALTSERTFARRFRAVTGTTPAAWVARMRLAHAQRLLESSDLAIEEVAREAGFGEPAVLRQHFARTLGTSPRAYRERFRAA